MERSYRWKRTKTSGATWQRLFGLVAAAFLLSESAEARIGETEAEIGARYGDPIATVGSSAQASLTKCYLSGAFSIAVTFVGGRSAREMLAKADKSKITDKEIQFLLVANGGGSSWDAEPLDGQKDGPASLLAWRTVDERSRVAFYDSRMQAFFVNTQHFINLTNATNRRALAKAQRGGLMPGEHGERLMRSVRNGNAAGMLRGHQAQPSPSPARK